MIFVTDKGRMCNNILQYGHVYAWGREHNRKTISLRFAHMYSDFAICHTRFHNWLVYLFVKCIAWMGIIPTVSFDNPDTDYTDRERVMLRAKWMVVTGWNVRFYDLFEKYKHEILSLFAFSSKVTNPVEKRLATAGEGAVKLGVHIRRGDYATWCSGHYFYNDQQYGDIISQFVELMNGRRVDVYICGNDPTLDKDYYRQRFGADRVHFPNGTPSEDVCLFSCCDYLIGPPSTFTLASSMYRDTPLYWIVNPGEPLRLDAFKPFNHQFRVFDSLFIPK